MLMDLHGMGLTVPHPWADRGWAQRAQDLLWTDPV